MAVIGSFSGPDTAGSAQAKINFNNSMLGKKRGFLKKKLGGPKPGIGFRRPGFPGVGPIKKPPYSDIDMSKFVKGQPNPNITAPRLSPDLYKTKVLGDQSTQTRLGSIADKIKNLPKPISFPDVSKTIAPGSDYSRAGALRRKPY